MLYNGLAAFVGPQGAGFAHVPLDVVTELVEKNPSLIEGTWEYVDFEIVYRCISTGRN
jgi:hypothetical protein